MTKRYVFYNDYKNRLKTVPVNIQWHWGSQQAKYQNVKELHQNFYHKYHLQPIEISSASQNPWGKDASAFNLFVRLGTHGTYRMEQLFQAGKVFKNHGSQQYLLNKQPWQCKKLIKPLNRSDKLVRFQLFGKKFGLEPKTYFYDWHYMHGLMQHPKLAKHLLKHKAFTDIFVNPKYTINTQAKSCALFQNLDTRFGWQGMKKLLAPKNTKQFIHEAYPNFKQRSVHLTPPSKHHMQHRHNVQGNLFHVKPLHKKHRTVKIHWGTQHQDTPHITF